MAKNEKVTFKISLDSSKFVSSLKAMQKGLESIAEQSKKGKITHKEAAAQLSVMSEMMKLLSSGALKVEEALERSEQGAKGFKQELNPVEKGKDRMT